MQNTEAEAVAVKCVTAAAARQWRQRAARATPVPHNLGDPACPLSLHAHCCQRRSVDDHHLVLLCCVYNMLLRSATACSEEGLSGTTRAVQATELVLTRVQASTLLSGLVSDTAVCASRSTSSDGSSNFKILSRNLGGWTEGNLRGPKPIKRARCLLSLLN